jgi:preprotein translocase subunit SecA
MQLIDRVKREAIQTLQLVQFNFETPESQAQERARLEAMREELEANLANMVTNEDELVEADFEEGEAPVHKPIRSEKKPKRNDPCPCGSGKKYKQCCGKSGPKRGILA